MTTPPLIIETYKGRGSQPWRWRLKTRNGRIIADCAEGYSGEYERDRAVVKLEDTIAKSKTVQVVSERKRKGR